ncbi:MAG TPA: multicopper oxidase domain-containing protein [Solirubrobacterales bacterium]
MSFGPTDRRSFLSLAGATFVCTLAGQRVNMGEGQVDVAQLSNGVDVPPRVAAANGGSASASAAAVAAASAGGQVREHWLAAEQRRWNIVPTHRDQMMAEPVKGKTTFEAYGYRPYSPGFEAPLGPATVPGPLIEAEVGDTVVVHFRNELSAPVTIHPHGVFYSNEMDGTYKGKWTGPGGFVQRKRTFTYVWECREGTEGTWLYHDHGPMDPLPVFRGLFGPLLVRKPGEARPEREFFLAFHTWDPSTTGLRDTYYCINGRAYAGNTPTLEAKVGERVRFHVYGVDNFFHTFHLHGHRWTEPDGTIVDNRPFGPADSFSLEFVEDNPGRWFYHCHVFQHLHQGMNGWYVVS